MLFPTVLVLLARFSLNQSYNVSQITQIRSGYMEPYGGYVDVALMHFEVPPDITEASFKFVADELNLSLFGCDAKNLTVYIKRASPPVINPDGSSYPENYIVDNKTDLWSTTFMSDKTVSYINISTPRPGIYFVVGFQSYEDPQKQGITQEGLTAQCYSFVDCGLYVQKPLSVDIAAANQLFETSLQENSQQIYKFYVPPNTNYLILRISKVQFCDTCFSLIIRIQIHRIPTVQSSLKTYVLKKGDTNLTKAILSEEDVWYYISFEFQGKTKSSTIGSFAFMLKFYMYTLPKLERYSLDSSTDLFKNSTLRIDRSVPTVGGRLYKQYDLLRDSSSDSFLYTFDLRVRYENDPPIPINLTSTDFTVLKFKLRDFVDVGGTLQYILSFKPNVRRKGFFIEFIQEPENHVIIGCIGYNRKEIPTWPNQCSYLKELSDAPIVLNSSTTNSSISIPYPKSGEWFASIKLFCGKCEPCECPVKCQTDYNSCIENCISSCTVDDKCSKCPISCADVILKLPDCAGCDCDGPCKKSNTTCNTSILFDITSMPCSGGRCGENGKCQIMLAESFAYSSCICRNNYRGWGCTDDTLANPIYIVVLELLLLTLSNLAFLPATYLAYKRHYYVEAVVYFSTCFFSSFYHACDAGENLISFCITRLEFLQFQDFYCGLLSIWVTLVAISDVQRPWNHIYHMLGCILLAFGTVIDKTSLWVFLLPALVGVIIVGTTWYLRYRRSRKIFPSKRYLTMIFPSGILVVAVALIAYAFFQTKSNYKYVHSMWHVFMAAGVMILLPHKKSFLPHNLI